MDAPGGLHIASLALCECVRPALVGLHVLRGYLMRCSRKRSPVLFWVGALCFLAERLLSSWRIFDLAFA